MRDWLAGADPGREEFMNHKLWWSSWLNHGDSQSPSS